ncbi:hypothetical protein KY284_011800 [Solanum tuberosum]|nr:hypothetical protein KY284_011800 [Solanum tuberosum]
MENEEKKEVKNHQSSSSMHPISVFLCLSILICCPKAFNLPFPKVGGALPHQKRGFTQIISLAQYAGPKLTGSHPKMREVAQSAGSHLRSAATIPVKTRA